MKKFNNTGLRSALLILCAGFGLTACDKDDDVADNSRTITEIVTQSNDFSTLETAVTRANLATTLNSPGPFTVFAPNNAAFASAGITTAVISSLSPTDVADILLYHTLGEKIVSSAVPAGPNAKVITASGDSIFVTRNSNGVFVNGVKVIQADVNAENGVIHVIGNVLLPPVGDLVETLTAPGSGYDSLVKAAVRVNNEAGGNPALLSTLSTAKLTLFAPDNAAFTQLLSALSLNDINDIPIATLSAVLAYHVVSGRAFSSDLSNGSLTMLAGGNSTINLTNGAGGGPTITGSGNGGMMANITGPNRVASNGVIHKIDRVLLP